VFAKEVRDLVFENQTNKVYVFSVDPDIGEPALRYVHPRRQIYLQALLLNIPDEVDELWVYGSAVTPNHYPWSDFDVLVLGDRIGDYQLAELRESAHEASRRDTWNECKDVSIISMSRGEFLAGCEERGSFAWNVWHNGIKYYDKAWFASKAVSP